MNQTYSDGMRTFASIVFSNAAVRAHRSLPVALQPACLCGLLLLLGPLGAVAEEPDWVELPLSGDAYEENWVPGEREGYMGWLLDQRNAWSNRIGKLGRRLDGFFANKEAHWSSNGSYMKIGAYTVFRKNGEIDFDPRIKVRLDMPYTKEKFRLIIENDPDDEKSIQERARSRSLTSFERNRASTTGAIRYIFDELDHWRLSTDVGIKARFPPDPFVRGRAIRDWELENDWSARFYQRVYWFLDDGLGETSELYFEKSLSQTMLFRAQTEAQWSHEDARWEFGQIFSILQRIDPVRAAEWQIGALGENQPNVRSSAYFANVTYRRLLYKDWLFYEMTPELLFPRDDSFRPNPSFSLGLEVIFSEE